MPKRRLDSRPIFMSASFHDKRACMRNDDATPERCGWPIILALVCVHVDDEGSTESSVLLFALLHGKLTDPDLAAAAAIEQTAR